MSADDVDFKNMQKRIRAISVVAQENWHNRFHEGLFCRAVHDILKAVYDAETEILDLPEWLIKRLKENGVDL